VRDLFMTRSTARRWPGKVLSYERVKEERREDMPFMIYLQNGYRASTRTCLDDSVLIVGAMRT
jgi:preprotein translocase subunit SecD